MIHVTAGNFGLSIDNRYHVAGQGEETVFNETEQVRAEVAAEAKGTAA